MPRSGWVSEECLVCHRLMTHLLILVVESVKLADGQIAIIDPPLGKVCSRACLRAWAARQDDPGPLP